MSLDKSDSIHLSRSFGIDMQIKNLKMVRLFKISRVCLDRCETRAESGPGHGP